MRVLRKQIGSKIFPYEEKIHRCCNRIFMKNPKYISFTIISILALIELFLEMLNFLEIICLKCHNLRKLQGRAKYKNWWKPRSLLLQTSALVEQVFNYPIYISPSYNLVKYISPHFSKNLQ
jgi:hypothetical protein